ncbi:hypothetical protein J2780_001172 [Chryseobacterium camelliae]|nr:hypothetical protein [Chryseobacterium camelliae]
MHERDARRSGGTKKFTYKLKFFETTSIKHIEGFFIYGLPECFYIDLHYFNEMDIKRKILWMLKEVLS